MTDACVTRCVLSEYLGRIAGQPAPEAASQAVPLPHSMAPGKRGSSHELYPPSDGETVTHGLWKPFLGTRSRSGVCPPSKPGRGFRPAAAHAALVSENLQRAD
jgi:hypothetical protein